MSVAFKVEANWEGLAEVFRDAPDRFNEERSRILLGAANLAADELRVSVMQRNAKDPTGDLARDMRAQLVAQDGEIVAAEAGSDLPYAGVQNDGDAQHGINALKKLAVPLSFANIPKGKRPADFGDALKLIKRKGKDSLLATFSSKAKKLQPKYVLKDSVNIPGTHYGDAAMESAGPKIDDYIAGEIEALIDEMTDEEIAD